MIGACIAAGIMLDPQGADGVDILLSSPDHIGTSVPIMLAWLILDRTRPSWRAVSRCRWCSAGQRWRTRW